MKKTDRRRESGRERERENETETDREGGRSELIEEIFELGINKHHPGNPSGWKYPGIWLHPGIPGILDFDNIEKIPGECGFFLINIGMDLPCRSSFSFFRGIIFFSILDRSKAVLDVGWRHVPAFTFFSGRKRGVGCKRYR